MILTCPNCRSSGNHGPKKTVTQIYEPKFKRHFRQTETPIDWLVAEWERERRGGHFHQDQLQERRVEPGVHPIQPHLRKDAVRGDQEPHEEVPGHPQPSAQNIIPLNVRRKPRSTGQWIQVAVIQAFLDLSFFAIDRTNKAKLILHFTYSHVPNRRHGSRRVNPAQKEH